MLALPLAVLVALPAGAAGAATGSAGVRGAQGAVGSTHRIVVGATAAAVAAAVAHEGTVAPAGSQTVSAVVSLTPPAGSDAAMARLAAGPRALTEVARVVRVAELARLAPAAAGRATVLAWAAAHGLTVTRAGSWDVTVSGSAAAMASAFATQLVAAPSRFAPGGPARYLRAATAPTVPAALRTVARAVVGLDNRPIYAPRAHPAFVLGDAGFIPDQVRDAYAAPSDPAAGAGITVASVQFSGFDSADLVNYALAADTPLFAGQLTTVSVDGADPTLIDGNGGDVEVSLDTEALLAVAPMARQRAYFAPNTTAGSVDAYAKMADDAVAGKIQVVSSSWGHCEADLDVNEGTLVRTQIQRLVAAGATMSASSGDNGSTDCPLVTGSNQVDFPTSVPEVVSVGGTTLTNGYQTAWGGSGGGVSTIYAQPAYQSALSGTKRRVPDVALLADPSTPFAIVHGQFFVSIGGTSLASPVFAGLLAAALSENGRTTGLGDIHTDLYNAPDSAFQDVISGDNGFAAGVGYDNVTGLGAPRFGALAAALGIPALARATYHPIDPTRIADTRNGTGVPLAKVGAGHTITVALPSSAPGVPASGITAAVVNVTAVGASASTYLSVYPTGAVGGSSSSAVNVAPGVPIPNLVMVKANAAGNITVYNSAGTVDVLVDLEGYFARDSNDLFTAQSPTRILDTRAGTGAPLAKVGPAGSITLHVAGAGGLPASGIDAVTLNVTAVGASTTTYVSAFPTGFAGGPLSSNLNVARSRAVANLVITKVSPAGDVTLYNSAGTVDLIADVAGYYGAGSGLSLAPIAPVRVVDSRGGAALGPAAARPYLVAASGTRPGAVVLNLAGVQPTNVTYLSLFPVNVSTAVGKLSSALNLGPGGVRANLATTAIAAGNPVREQVYNSVGTIDVLADVAGYFSGQAVLLPQTSVTLSAPSTATSSTMVTFSASASTAGPSVASLAPGAVVTFVQPGVLNSLATVTIAGNGSASFSTSSLSIGTHTVYAVVASHDGIAGSTSAPVTITITP